MDIAVAIASAVLIGLLLFWLGSKRRAQRHSDDAPRRSKTTREALDTVAAWPPHATRILTAAERKACQTLRSAFPEHWVLAQLPLSRFMKVPTRHSYAEWLRRVGMLSADLVLCDNDSQVLAVIDVRAPHNKENERARQRHRRMDRVLQAAGIAVHIWHEDAIPSPAAARSLLLASLKQPLTTAPPVARTTETLSASSPARSGTGGIVPDILLDDEHDESPHHLHEPRDPPPSTWFDELDSGAVPLMSPSRPPEPGTAGGKPGRST